MRFEFATATRIIFGAGTLPQAAAAAQDMGRRALLVTDPRTATLSRPLSEALTARGIEQSMCCITGEPTTDIVTVGLQRAHDNACDIVIGIGGGSVLDTAKAIAALMTNTGEILDYLEVIGKGRALIRPAAPCIAIPTTAGTGAEVTRNAVLTSPTHGVKVSLRSPWLLPRLALIDPELTISLPPDLTATTGMDALTQLIEPFVCTRATPLTDAICRLGLPLIARSLRSACAQQTNIEARTNMSLASLCGGLALANAGLGAVHGLAAPMGGMFTAPHGAICARLLPEVMQANVNALRQRQPHSPALERYVEIARLLTDNSSASAEEGIAWVRELVADLHIPPLSTWGVPAEAASAIVEKALAASSMQANPIPLTPPELHTILEKAW